MTGNIAGSPTLTTFGETMLRYSPPGNGRLETSEQFDVHVGGAESNVAVAASRLGVDSCWLSRLPETRLGRRIVGSLQHHGVETGVDWAEIGRVGTYYLEPGGKSRQTAVVYDREGAAIRQATTEALATDRIQTADAFHVTGITPALSETLAETASDLLDIAGEAGTTRVFDVNYRAKLWSPAAARDTLTDILPRVDTLVVAQRDAATVFDRDGSTPELAREFAADYDIDTVVMTEGGAGATALRGDTVVSQPTFEAADTHPVGTGDAFVGGFLAAELTGNSLERALATGAATAALKREIPGDMATVDSAEVERLLAGADDGISR